MVRAAVFLSAVLFVQPASSIVGLDLGEEAEDAVLPESLLSEDECLASGNQQDCALHALQVKVRAVATGNAAPTPPGGKPSTAYAPPPYPPEPTLMPQAARKEDAADAGGKASSDHVQGPPGGTPNFEDVYPEYPPEPPFIPYSEYGPEYPEYGSKYPELNDTAGNLSNLSNESGLWVPYPSEEPYLPNGAYEYPEDVFVPDGYSEGFDEPSPPGWEPGYDGPVEYPEEVAPQGYYIDDAAPYHNDYAELSSDGDDPDAVDDYDETPPVAAYNAGGDAYDGGVPPEDLQAEPDLIYAGPGPEWKERAAAPAENQGSP